jgi:hypothetical protein
METADKPELESLRVLFDDARGMDLSEALLSGDVLAAVKVVEEATDPVAELTATGILLALLKRLTAPTRNVILQNRDRSTPAMIAQMNSIAAMPDYYRVAPTKEFASGTPIVFGNDDAMPSRIALGRKDKAVAADGRRFAVQYAVVEAADLLTSNTADGLSNADYTNGAPGKLRAIAGNGRVAGLVAGFARGTAAEYVRELREDETTGIASTQIDAFDAPVLVRIMRAEDVTDNIGDISNQRGTSDLSPVEAAQNDAKRLDLSDLDVSDDGKPTEAAALDFIAAMPESERNNLMDGKHPGQKAYDRLMAAVFWKAYGDAELVRLYAQSVDPEIKTILGGMAAASSELARLEGAGDLDFRGIVTEAASLAINAKRQGVKLAEFAKQTDMTLSPDTMAVVRLFADNIRSAKKIGERLRTAARFAYEEFTKDDSDMFGPVEKATRAQVLEQLSAGPAGVSMFDSVDPLRAIELSGSLMQLAASLSASDDPLASLDLSNEILTIIRELEESAPEPQALSIDERIARATEMGAQAFADGLGSAPALNPAVMPLIAGLPVGGGTNEILTAYTKAWHTANAANARIAPVEPDPVEAAPIVPPVATRGQGMKALERLTAFLPRAQRTVMASAMSGEEGQHFIDMAIEWANVIDTMPGTYDTDGMGLSAPARLHYFNGGSDWYITEKDKSGNGTRQAFGLAILNGDLQNAELGYISIDELVRNGVELDLYWVSKPVGSLKNPDWTPEPADSLDAGKTPDEAAPVVPDSVGQPATTLSDEIMQKYIAIAADSIEALRRIDVYRVLDALPADNPDGMTRAALATWIVTKRPDLLQEVASVMAEEWPGDGWAAPTAAEPAATLTEPLPEGVTVVPPVVPAENGNRAADLDFLKAVEAQSIDMMADGVAERIETTLGAYPGDSEIEAAVRAAVASYTDYMTKAIGA